MTAVEAVAAGQVLAESLMLDTCTITRGDAAPTFDATTGAYTADPSATKYAGKCRVKPSNLSANRTVQAGDTTVALWPFSVSVPVSAADVELDDVVTVTGSVDPSLVDREFRVRAVARGTYLTARRLDVEETE